MRNKLPLSLVAAGFGLLATGAFAASFTPLTQKRFERWESSLYRNDNTRQQFCAAETQSSQKTDMRLNFYRTGSSFIEFFNPTWNLMKGEASFSLRFDSGFTVNFRGKSWGDSYTHDFTDKTMVHALFGLLVKEKSVQLLNANGAPLSTFSLAGSKAALQDLDSCVGGI